MIFVLISDIDKSYKSWYSVNINGKVWRTDFVKQLEKIGRVVIPKPNFVNFRKYDKLDMSNNKGYGSDIIFNIEDLHFENHSEWVYEQIGSKEKFFVIGYEQGGHMAKHLANSYPDQCVGIMILGNRIFSKRNFEKLWKADVWRDQLKDTFGDDWWDYDLDTMTNDRLHDLLREIEVTKEQKKINYVNGFCKGINRSQYDKVVNSLVPATIYSNLETKTDEKVALDKEFRDRSKANVDFIYLDNDAPYFIFSRHKDDIVNRIKSMIKGQTGGIYRLKYKKYKAKYVQLRGGDKDVKKIFFVRHGETEWNKLGKIQGGDVDIPLNKKGIEQSIKTGKYLNKYGPFDCIFSSPMIRAKKTAELIKDQVGFKGKIIEMDGLIEGMNGDKITGKTDDDPYIKKMNEEIMSYFGDDAIENSLKILDVMDKIAEKYGGESQRKFRARIKKAFDEIMKMDCSNFLIVAHGGVIEDLLEEIFKTVIERGDMKAGSNCYISFIQWDKTNGFKMITTPNTKHLN